MGLERFPFFEQGFFQTLIPKYFQKFQTFCRHFLEKHFTFRHKFPTGTPIRIHFRVTCKMILAAVCKGSMLQKR